MEIVSFPGGKKFEEKRKNKVSVAKVNQSESNMMVGPITITCHNCGNKTSFSTEGMIFKTIDMYCSSCGTEHKISNPCFSKATAKQVKSKLNTTYKK